MRALLMALVLVLALPALAIEPGERLDDPALEARARAISKQLRCVVCQNESIDTSQAGIAKDMRRLVRERLVAGDSDEEVMGFMVARYGDFVLLNPPFKPATYLLWLGPPAVLLLGAAGLALIIRQRRRRPAPAPTPLSESERQRLAQVLAEDETT